MSALEVAKRFCSPDHATSILGSSIDLESTVSFQESDHNAMEAETVRVGVQCDDSSGLQLIDKAGELCMS